MKLNLSFFVAVLGSVLMIASSTRAQQPAPSAGEVGKTPPANAPVSGTAAPEGFVSRKEYDALLKRLADMEARLAGVEGKGATREKEVDESLDALESRNQELQKQINVAKPGTTDFLLTGYAFGGFEKQPGESGRFTAGFSPILLWKLDDRLFFEGELEIGLKPSETEVNLEYADIGYLLNDYVTLKAGKFLTPFSTFMDRLHPAWINKLPDFPLPFDEESGIAPRSLVGVQASGGFPVGSTKFNYAFYAGNGPGINHDASQPESLGRLNFEDNFSGDNSRAYGGRIGFLPVPQLEVGYSLQLVRGPVNARLHAVDAAFGREINWLRGALELRTELMWSDASNFRAEPTGGDPFTFANKRRGGYAQMAYRPTKASSDLLKKFELVGRYDWLDQPGGHDLPGNRDRWTVGLNYWLGPSTVLKAAYEFHHGDAEEARGNGILIQAAIGF